MSRQQADCADEDTHPILVCKMLERDHYQEWSSSSLDMKTSLHTEDRGLQVPMTLEPDKHLTRPDPIVRQRI
jgi:hypothetical protein